MNMNTRLTLLAAALATLATASATPSESRDFGWLAGSWCGEREGIFSEELWTAPRGGLLLGIHRDTRADGATTFEFLRIELRGEDATYLAQPGGRPPTAFALRERNARSATFVNDRHDFPKRVRYERLDAERLRARVDDGRNGGAAEEWIWRRCSRQEGF